MIKTITALAAGLMAISSLASAAQAAPVAQERPYSQQGPMSGPMNHNGPGPDRNGPGRPGQNDDQYGRWDNSWGARPTAPPRGWTRHNDWYRHVRACSQRFRSYNPRTDTYVVRRGRTAQCRL